MPIRPPTRSNKQEALYISLHQKLEAQLALWRELQFPKYSLAYSCIWTGPSPGRRILRSVGNRAPRQCLIERRDGRPGIFCGRRRDRLPPWNRDSAADGLRPAGRGVRIHDLIVKLKISLELQPAVRHRPPEHWRPLHDRLKAHPTLLPALQSPCSLCGTQLFKLRAQRLNDPAPPRAASSASAKPWSSAN